MSPSSADVLLGNNQQFVVNVSGTTNRAVTWSVNGVAEGNASVGQISSGGLYTAPKTLPSPATVTVTATSQADASKTASATITVTSDVRVSLGTVPAGVTTVQTSTKLQLAATITSAGNPSQGLTWSVNSILNGNSTVGTIASSGLNAVYTAPAAVPSPSTVTIQATSVADATKSAQLTVTVAPPPVQVVVSPALVTLQTGAQQQFTAMVTGTSDTAVTWSVNGVVGGKSGVGTISSHGLYTAPATAPNPNPVTVTATSVADPTKSASATVTIVGTPSISSVQPTSFAQGAAGPITIAVNGANFSTASVVRIDNGSGPDQRSTSFVSSSQLRALLLASDFATQHTALIDVFQTPSGPRSNLFGIIVAAAAGTPRSVFVNAGQTSAGNDITVSDASTSPPLNISFVGVGSTAHVFSVQVSRGTSPTVLIFGDGLSQRDSQGNITPLASVRISGPPDITVSNVTGTFSQSGRPGLRFTVNVSSTAQTGPRNIIVQNANLDMAIAFGALIVQ